MDGIQFPKLGLEFHVSRVAFTIDIFNFKLDIYWYGVLITLGMLLAMLYVFRRSKSYGVDPDRFFDAAMAGLVGAIIGLRLYYVIPKWDEYKDNWVRIFDIRDGGLGFYGGLIGAILIGGVLVGGLRKLRLPPTLDLVALGFLIGQAFGRWGNFFNQEAFGTNTDLPWGMTGPGIVGYLQANKSVLSSMGVTVVPTDPVHPCFLYESLWCALGFVILHLYSKRRKFDGEVFLMYIAWYGVGRAVIESLRTDSLTLGNLRTSQALGIISALIAVAAIIMIRSRIKRSGEYVFYKDTDEFRMLLAESEAQNAPKSKRIADSADVTSPAESESVEEIVEPSVEASPEEVVAEESIGEDTTHEAD